MTDATMTPAEALAHVADAARTFSSPRFTDRHQQGPALSAAYRTLSAALQARDAEVERLTRESEGRRVTLLEKAEEARTEWKRAEQAEAECARLRSALAHIVAVLGPNVPASVTSSGARYEWADALGTAEDALTPHVEPVGINAGGDAEGGGACWCLTCRPQTLSDMRFVVCPDCGNKRCPHANDHRNACTNSNAPGQPGSAYPPNEAGHEEREDG